MVQRVRHCSSAARRAASAFSCSGISTRSPYSDGYGLLVVSHLEAAAPSWVKKNAWGERWGSVLTFHTYIMYVNQLHSTMIREILHFIISLPSLAVKFVEWVFNPKNGDEWVTPFTRRFLSTGASFVITVLYHVTV